MLVQSGKVLVFIRHTLQLDKKIVPGGLAMSVLVKMTGLFQGQCPPRTLLVESYLESLTNFV